MAPLLGCIADDFTGATDLAGTLVLKGMRTTVMLGVPGCTGPADADAVVVALKSRNASVSHAIESSVTAMRWLRDTNCRQFYFKYCSTFDSTPRGNIGPVAEALMHELGTDFTIACPAFPANRRTVYNGYLFVDETLLEESPMQFHPLNPMTDSNLVRLLQAQCMRKVGLIGYPTVRSGSAAILGAVREARALGTSLAIVDAVSETDLCEIAFACQDLPLLTGASGLAKGVAETFCRRGLLGSGESVSPWPLVRGLSAAISGSCSATTQRQVAWMEERMPTFRIDPVKVASDPDLANKILQWAAVRMADGPVLIAATATAEAVKATQAKLGAENARHMIEHFLAKISLRLVEHGARRLIVAGGETSATVMQALNVCGLRVGPQIDPGIHWSFSDGEPRLALALKSGNFGTDDFFTKSWSLLP